MVPTSTESIEISEDALARAAKMVRVLTVDAVRQAGIGHVGLPLGCAELGVLLYGEILKHDPQDPAWHDRDRFVLSAGHGSMLLYSLLHLSGYEISAEDLRNFRQLGSITPGHPERGMTPGVECTTGPLGQGMGNAVGMALAERILAARFGSELIDHRTYVLASDGDLMEGVASEAASLAGHLGLGRLIAFYDDNRITIDGPTSLSFSEQVGTRFEAYGWEVQTVDGYDIAEIRGAVRQAQADEDRPHLIICRTKIGFGSPAVDTSAAHGALGDERTQQTRDALGWTLPPFEIPDDARDAFLANSQRGAEVRAAWENRKAKALADPGVAERWASMLEGQLPADLDAVFPDFASDSNLATRQASGKIINSIASKVPSLIGGSADLAGSNGTTIKDESHIERGKFQGRNINYGVREHGMGAIANGMALHQGVRPFVGTFLVFSDYMRPAIRLAALSELPVVYVFTHDSIFVGEDGPTHQPVEHVASLRAIPNLRVWRPADARETAVAWTSALRHTSGPTALALTRQGLPTLEQEGVEEGASKGGYVLLDEPADASLELVLIGTGSEISLALEAGERLKAEGRVVRVISLPCVELFESQSPAYRESVLGDAPRLVVEAGVQHGLDCVIRPQDLFHGMTRFGASASYTKLAEHFGFTVEAVLEKARSLLT